MLSLYISATCQLLESCKKGHRLCAVIRVVLVANIAKGKMMAVIGQGTGYLQSVTP